MKTIDTYITEKLHLTKDNLIPDLNKDTLLDAIHDAIINEIKYKHLSFDLEIGKIEGVDRYVVVTLLDRTSKNDKYEIRDAIIEYVNKYFKKDVFDTLITAIEGKKIKFLFNIKF